MLISVLIVLIIPNSPDFDNYTVSTFAGLAGSSGLTNGLGSQARFNNPMEFQQIILEIFIYQIIQAT